MCGVATGGVEGIHLELQHLAADAQGPFDYDTGMQVGFIIVFVGVYFVCCFNVRGLGWFARSLW